MLFDAEQEKLKDPSYPGGGLSPAYGPSIDYLSRKYNRYAYRDLLLKEWELLLFGPLKEPI